MKILFVSSGNSRDGISPIIKNQGDSLVKYQNVYLDYYCIKGKGISGYIKNIKPIRKKIKEGQYDVIHAHYSLSAFAASLAGAKHLVVSLMGSDVKANELYKFVILLFNNIFRWKCVIVKSEDMKKSLGYKKAIVIPNGVDLDRFKPLDKEVCQESLGWDKGKRHILFAANKDRPEKNFASSKQAVDLLNDSSIELHTLNNVANEDMPTFYNAAEVVILSSLWEGSPNVIKEAMACNRPIVCTDVGDVKDNLNGVDNCFVTSFDVKLFSSLISKAITGKTSSGVDKLLKMGIDSKSVARRLINIYQD